MRKRILWAVGILLLATLIFGGTITALIAEETPAVSIEYFTLSHDNTVYIKYAVDCRNYEVTRENTGMLYWTAEPENAIIGTEESRSTILGYELIEGQKYYIFKYDRLSAAQMCDDIWARAYVTVDDKTYYSDVEKYSVETYAAHKLGLVEGSEATSDETLRELLYAMLEYGEKAQKHFPEARKDIFPTDILHPFTVSFDADNGTDTFTQTVYRNRKAAKPEAPVKDGCTFVGWFNGDTEWNFETDTVTEDVTLTAKWGIPYSEGLLFTSNGDGTCAVSGIGTCTDTVINIPPVTQDGDRVISIGNNAFYGCSRLMGITIPDGVTHIGNYAFHYCSRLTNITIPNSVSHLGNYAFYECKSLTSVTIQGSVTSIGASTFNNCSSLTSITMPNSVTSIGEFAFYCCSSLINIIIPDSVISIGGAAFQGCNSLTSITIPNGVTSIDSYVFCGCTSLTDITIPNGVTSIDRYAFYGCTGLTDVTIPDGVTSIGYDAFSKCTGLTRISIPDSVMSIGADAFLGCSSLKMVCITDLVKWSGISFGDYDANPLSCAHNLYLNGTLVTDLVIPDGVTNFGFSFYGCSCLVSITIPDSVTSIVDYAFYSCSSLTSIKIPDSVTSIGYGAFKGCSSLTDITIGKGVTSVGKFAFENCSGLTSITIPDSVTSIGFGVFCGCDSLTSMMLPFIGTRMNETIYLGYFFGGLDNNDVPSSLKTVVITGVTYIEPDAFEGCSGLTSIVIPDSVTSIGFGAFEGCSSLTSITLPFVGEQKNETEHFNYFGYIFGASNSSKHPTYVPSSLKTVVITGGTSISSYAFEGCSNLTSITIPDSVTSIGAYAFRDCSSLIQKEGGVWYVDRWVVGCDTSVTNIILRDNTIGISDSAFSGCSSLTCLTIPEGTIGIGSSAFKDCSSLTSITIPDSVRSIGSSAFKDCSSLTSITIPDGVRSIGSSAFEDCSSLISITIPNSVRSIGSSAFKDCDSLIQKEDGVWYVDRWVVGCDTSIRNIILRDNTIGIIDSAFSHCSNLMSITIPDSVTSICKNAFWCCSSLQAVYITNLVTWCGIPFENVSANPLSYAYRLYLNGTLVTDLVIPDGVMSIGDFAFYGCSSLTSITIPDSVTNIGNYAFYGCSSLTRVTIPDSVMSIGESAFSRCTGLVSITIGNSVTSIGIYTFYGCTGLESVTIGNSVTNIGNHAFLGCTGLRSIMIPDSVTNIEREAFSGCTDLTSITFIGTQEQWNAISKESGWNNNTGSYTIHCTDGDIAKS